MKRRYAVDDCDFDDYKAAGGPLSRAEYFNAMLGPRPQVRLGHADKAPAPLSQRLAELTGRATAPASLSKRIRQDR